MEQKRIPAREVVLGIRVSPGERKQLEDAAWKRQQRLSEFVRQQALAGATRVLKEGK